MFCQNCGAQLPEYSNFCPNCGYQQGYQPTQDINQYYQGNEPTQWADQQNQFRNDTLYQNFARFNPFEKNQTQVGAGLPMKWFEFVVKIQLFLSAAISFVDGVISVTGLQYGDSREGVYEHVYGSQEIDIVCGVVSIALAVYAIYVRQSLVRYKAGAPTLYILFLIFYFVNDIIEPIFSTIVSGMSMFGIASYSSIITTAIMVYCNVIYFKKRQYMFVN